MTLTERYIDADEGREFTASKACYNCRAKAANGAWLNEYTLPEGTEVWACDECIAEAERVELQANEMASRPSCEERQRIIERAQTTQQLVNQLRAHDQTGCLDCTAVQMIACDDCGRPVAPHALDFDEAFQLRTCAACTLKQARIDAIVAAHNAEKAAA